MKETSSLSVFKVCSVTRAPQQLITPWVPPVGKCPALNNVNSGSDGSRGLSLETSAAFAAIQRRLPGLGIGMVFSFLTINLMCYMDRQDGHFYAKRKLKGEGWEEEEDGYPEK